MNHQDSTLDLATWAVAGVAAINWGAVGALDLNLLTEIGLTGSDLHAVYIVIGLVGVINLYLLYDKMEGSRA